ncbi:MAG: NAD-binding protein [Thermoplasmata archaeon]
MRLPGGTGSAAIPPQPTQAFLSSRAPRLALLSAGIGALLVVLGILSAWTSPAEFYRDSFSGYDPPFDAVSGLLLLALSFRIRDRSPVAWLFSLLAPVLTVGTAVLSPNPYSLVSAVAATALVAALYPYRSGFYRGSATGPEATQLLVIVAALVTILFGMVGTRWLGDQFSPPIQGWVESLYVTVATVSTNGTNYTPMTDSARWFSTLLILFGVGTFLSAVVVLFLPFLERRLERIAQRLERAQMEDLSDHVIICGVTSQGRAVADSLRAQGVRAVLIAPDQAAIERLRAEGYRTHFGDPSVEEELTAVGIGRARSLVAADESDAANLLTVITARGLQPKLRIVAVGTAPTSLAKLRKAGADEAISVVTVAAQLVSAAALERGPGAEPRTSSIAR